MSVTAPTGEALADGHGVILGVAVDHRDSLHAALRARSIVDVDDAFVAAIKLDVCSVLGPDASVLLVDHDTCRVLRALGGTVASVPRALPLEAQGYGALHEIEHTRLVEHPTPVEIAAIADACKLLLPLRIDHAEQAGVQVDVARATVDACRAAGLPLILEPIVWSAPGESLESARRSELVVEAARVLAPLDPGLLKLQYPGSRSGCDELHDACAGQPWVLLGGGAPIDELEQQVADACEAGARGCIVGRTLFDGALDRDHERRMAWLHEVAHPALTRLAHIGRTHSRAGDLPPSH